MSRLVWLQITKVLWNPVCRWHVMNYYVQLISRLRTSFIWFSFLGAAQFHSKARSFQDCVCPLLLSILFVNFIFPCKIHSLCVHLVSTCQNQKSVDINLLTRLTVHMLEPLFVRMKPDNIFITCSCRGYGCIVAAIVYIFYQLISQGNKIIRTWVTFFDSRNQLFVVVLSAYKRKHIFCCKFQSKAFWFTGLVLTNTIDSLKQFLVHELPLFVNRNWLSNMYTVVVIGSVWVMLILPRNFLMLRIENILPSIASHLMPLARFFYKWKNAVEQKWQRWTATRS